MKGFIALMLMVGAVSGCAPGASSKADTCSQPQSVLQTDIFNDPLNLDAPAGLLLSTHKRADESGRMLLSEETELSKCNVFMELLNKELATVRLWTASHCIRRLTVTSMSLAVRDKSSPTGGFLTWELQHEILSKAETMQQVYDHLGGYTDEKNRLARAWDRRRMMVYGDNALLTPRVSCENLRWSEQADNRHSLCFSVFDLMSFDIVLPEGTSARTKSLLESLSRFKKNQTTELSLAEKRNTFLHRLDLTSQSEWIIHIGNMVRTWMSGFSAAALPMFSEEVLLMEKLNRNVFSLPQAEEWSFIRPEPVTTQDAIPPNSNTTYQVIHKDTYVSPRTTINNVKVACYRQLRKYNPATGKVDIVAELELRPHEYCAGGAKQQADHFWNRDREWSLMMADMTVGAAQDYAQSVKDILLASATGSEQLNRLSVVSNFENEDTVNFDARETEDVSPFLRHLVLPAKTLTTNLNGLQNFQQTGAILFSLPREAVKARFQKGDSGAILLLDGVPVATLYSVDGEETSGGASIRSLPDASPEDGAPVASSGTVASGRKASLATGGCSK
ncbi:MAG: hypothetical protein RL189_544 [Pseudomonadota bacterium]